MEAIYQDYLPSGNLEIVTAGMDWGQPYSCESWATSFGQTFSVLDNMHFFFLDTSSNRYSILYDDVSNLKLKSEFICNYDKDLDISASLIYNKFFMNVLSKPYFVPELKINLGVSYVYDKQTSFIVDFSSGFKRWSNGQLCNYRRNTNNSFN